MPFNLLVLETGDCHTDTVVVLHLQLRQSRTHTTWEIEPEDREQHRSICPHFETEDEIRRAAEAAYDYGRQLGRWHIQRISGYEPRGKAVSPLGWEPERIQAEV